MVASATPLLLATSTIVGLRMPYRATHSAVAVSRALRVRPMALPERARVPGSRTGTSEGEVTAGSGGGQHSADRGGLRDHLEDRHGHRDRVRLVHGELLAHVTEHVGEPDTEGPADAGEQLGGGLLLAALHLAEVAQAHAGGAGDLAQGAVLLQARLAQGVAEQAAENHD